MCFQGCRSVVSNTFGPQWSASQPAKQPVPLLDMEDTARHGKHMRQSFGNGFVSKRVFLGESQVCGALLQTRLLSQSLADVRRQESTGLDSDPGLPDPAPPAPAAVNNTASGAFAGSRRPLVVTWRTTGGFESLAHVERIIMSRLKKANVAQSLHSLSSRI